MSNSDNQSSGISVNGRNKQMTFVRLWVEPLVLASSLLVGTSCIGVSDDLPPSDQETESASETASDVFFEADSWTSEEPELTVEEAWRVFSQPSGRAGPISMTKRDDLIGLAIGYDKQGSFIDGLFIETFPAQSPSSSNEGFLPVTLMPCPDSLVVGRVNIFGVGYGFKVVANTWLCAAPPCNCYTESRWSQDAVLDTSTGIIVPDLLKVPNGELDEDGTLILGDSWLAGSAGTANITFRMGRIPEESTNFETFIYQNYFWPSVDGSTMFVHPETAQTFLRNGHISYMASTRRKTNEYQNAQALFLAQASLDGTVIVEPRIVHVPPTRAGYSNTIGRHAFEARENEILAVSWVVYEKEPGDCLTDRYATRFALSGEAIGEPSYLGRSPVCPDANAWPEEGTASLKWSGEYYGYCDLEEQDGKFAYAFWVLSEHGERLAGPISLLTPVPGPARDLVNNAQCYVVPISNNQFAIAFVTPPQIPLATDGPGVYVTFVKYSGVLL